jgi:predicted ribosome quality control (RQC) complex YloA/Tae2 family protein
MRKVTKYIDAINEYIEYRVGQNAKENFDLIDDSEADDIWFHISQLPSCHVVASIPPHKQYDKNIIKKIAIQGAVICKQFSKYKSEKVVHVMYTPIHHVIKTPTVGAVSVEEYKTIII